MGNVRKSSEHHQQMKNNSTPKTRKRQTKEAGNILKSLTALSQVIDALIKKKRHVPYKDSKLTRILENSLGGNCKTALLICVSPHIYNRYETIRSLKFGSRCQKIENHIELIEDERYSKRRKKGFDRTSVRIDKPPLTLNDSKSLTLTLNDNNKSLTDNKSLKIKDVKSLQFKDMMKLDKKRTVQPQSNVDNEELMKQIEKLNIENDLLRTKNDLSQNVTTLNETISKIVLQNALKKNKNKKKKK